jgi:fatty acid amide hydrolase
MQLHELDASALLEALGNGETSSVQVVQALIDRRRAVDGRVGAFIAQLDEQALAAAKSADEARKTGSADTRPPLLGLPITIKDNIDVTGTDSTLGLPARRNQPATRDAVVVQALRQAGAIVLGKTNVPQALLVQESDNELFGVTRNPWNPSRTPGGSSGGEAAALASGQTPLGIGTDIGGSIRIPAHFTGICGLKPTVDRWSMRGVRGATEGQELVRAQIGPMARSVRDLSLVMHALSGPLQSTLDPAVSPSSMAIPQLPGAAAGLRIGCFTDDGFLTPAPSIQRAIREAKAALQAAGATVVDYQPPGAQELIYLWLAGISSDGGRTILRNFEGAKVCNQLKPTFLLSKMPGPLRLLGAKVLEGRGEARLAKLLRSLGEKSITELWQLTAQRTALRQKEFDAWSAAEIDAVICPPHVLPALPLGSSGDLTLTLSYMFRYVMLNFPAGVVPVTRVRADEESWPASPRDMLSKRFATVMRGASGLPVGVQVAARPQREDIALAVMAAIESEARRSPDYPRTPVEP